MKDHLHESNHFGILFSKCHFKMETLCNLHAIALTQKMHVYLILNYIKKQKFSQAKKKKLAKIVLD